MKKAKSIQWVFFFLLFSLTLDADPLIEVSRTRIDYGSGDSALGLVQSGSEHWKPLFFAIDGEGNIHVPDFYKARITVFRKDGSLKEAKPCSAGISPRLNFFGRTPKGLYVSYGDGTLSVMKPDGSLRWQYSFGYGVIPSRIITAESALFVILPPHLDKDGRSIVFDYGSSAPLGRFGLEIAAGRFIPVFQWNEQSAFTPLLADMGNLEGFMGKFVSSAKPAFIYAARTGKSLWSEKTEAGETIYLFSSTGDLLAEGRIFFPESLAGAGFWTIGDENLTVYKNYFFKDYMLIVSYVFKISN